LADTLKASQRTTTSAEDFKEDAIASNGHSKSRDRADAWVRRTCADG
jgi:hypothetical protein